MKPFWVFSGQGAQTPGMGRDLYENSAAARRVFEAADAALGYPLTDVIFNGPAEKLTSSIYCQCAIYATSCAALAAYREKLGSAVPRPVACAGLSLGEYAALYAAGCVDFADGIRLLDIRGHLMDEACRRNSGKMASVLGGDPQVIEEVASQFDIDVANYNCPGQIVISGRTDRLEAAVAELKNRNLRKVIVLNVAGAFHSRLMAEAGAALAEALAKVEFKLTDIPVYHNRTAAPADSPDMMRKLLAEQVAGSVRWEECLRRAASAGADTVIEFGPGTVLTGLAKRTLNDVKLLNVNSMASLSEL